jgi:hypothetical protein
VLSDKLLKVQLSLLHATKALGRGKGSIRQVGGLFNNESIFCTFTVTNIEYTITMANPIIVNTFVLCRHRCYTVISQSAASVWHREKDMAW